MDEPSPIISQNEVHHPLWYIAAVVGDPCFEGTAEKHLRDKSVCSCKKRLKICKWNTLQYNYFVCVRETEKHENPMNVWCRQTP